MSMPLIAARWGATASRLGAGQVFVWGGNVDAVLPDEVIAQAGEILGSSSGPVSSATLGFPAATALHTATPITGGVLLAGGLVVAPVTGMSGGMTIDPPAQPLTAITLDATMRPQATAVPVDPAIWPTPILHGAVALDDGSVVITGGSIRTTDALGMSTQLWPVGRAIRVARDGVGVYAASALPGLIVPRWGHAAAVLPGGRVFVSGGFVRSGSSLRAIAAPEILLLDAPPASISSCSEPGDAGTRPRDAGPRDAAPVPEDAPPVTDPDAGV
jgi:hypothetical protein